MISNDIDELPTISSSEQTNPVFDEPSTLLSYTTGPLSAAIINGHHHAYPNNHLPSNLTGMYVGSPIHERIEAEYDSMFTAQGSLNKELVYPTSDSPNDAPPIFRNILHVAIMYGKYQSNL